MAGVVTSTATASYPPRMFGKGSLGMRPGLIVEAKAHAGELSITGVTSRFHQLRRELVNGNGCKRRLQKLRLCGTETSQPLKPLSGVLSWKAKRGLSVGFVYSGLHIDVE